MKRITVFCGSSFGVALAMIKISDLPSDKLIYESDELQKFAQVK